MYPAYSLRIEGVDHASPRQDRPYHRSGSGFGEGIAKTFAREGAKVAVVDINLDAAKRVTSDIGAAAIAVKADVTSMAETEAAVKAAADFGGGRLDIVVNNAGWSHRNKPMMEVTEEEFDRVYAINVKAIFHMSRAIIPHYRAKGGGVILNIGSTAGIRPRPGLTWYNSTKGARESALRSMAVELAPDKIRVNCVAPVIGATGLLEPSWACRIRRKNARNFSAPSRSGASRRRTTSPMRASTSPRMMRISSRASCLRSMAAAPSDRNKDRIPPPVKIRSAILRQSGLPRPYAQSRPLHRDGDACATGPGRGAGADRGSGGLPFRSLGHQWRPPRPLP